MLKKVETETRNEIQIVTINRPEKRNAVDRETAQELLIAFESFDADESLRVAILTGAQGNFCSGADLNSIAARSDEMPQLKLQGDGPLGVSRKRLSKPVIAAIEGYAVAGGLELALWCDLRVAAENAVFGVFCRRFGVPLVDGGTIRLPRLIGQSRALDMILTGRGVSGEEAVSFGLVNRLCPKGGALEEAIKLAENLCSFPQECMRSDRLSTYEQWDLSVEEALTNESRHGIKVMTSGEAFEGARKFLEGD